MCAQAEAPRQFRPQRAADHSAFDQRRQDIDADATRFGKPRRPHAGPRIHQQRRGCIRTIGYRFTRKAQPHVVLGQQNMARTLHRVGLVAR